MHRHSVLILFFVFFFTTGFSQNINISIFNSFVIEDFIFESDSGKYDIISNNKIVARVDPHKKIHFKLKKNKIRLNENNGSNIGTFKEIHIRGRKQGNIFKIIPADKKIADRIYDNDLYVYVKGDRIRLINDVNFEKYIAGVVESEGGPDAPIEYYKTQAILCRTYAIKHFDKHLEEGFCLCDEVHCQAYKGRCKYNRKIYDAAVETAGLVIVDEQLRIISATFYANSGGETANSEDVWISKVPYLRSKPDSFSLNQPGSTWEKTISIEDWQKYLKTKNITPGTNLSDYTFIQKNRKKNYIHNGGTIPLKTIRTDWKLRSTFFDIIVDGNNLLLKGRGYGHGVGLSQEGAMQMARAGYDYEKIIKQYYTDVKIMSIKALNFFQVE